MNLFSQDTVVTMANGDKKVIDDVVVGDYVLGLAPDAGSLVATEVLDVVEDVMDVMVRIGVLNEASTAGRVIGCAPLTGIWMPHQGYFRVATSIAVGDAVLTATLKSLTFLQSEILAGRLLGGAKVKDGAIVFPERLQKDAEYRNHVAASLGWVQGPPVSDIQTADGVRIRGQSRNLLSIEEAFSGWNTSVPRAEAPTDFILTPISMAYWYMDSGELLEADGGRERVRFDTRHLSKATMNHVADCLATLGIRAEANDSQGSMIRIRAGDAERFLALVSPYIIASKQHLLPTRYRGLQNFRIPEPELDLLAPVTVKPVKWVQNLGDEGSRNPGYKLVTRCGSFFANGVLVMGQP